MLIGTYLQRRVSDVFAVIYRTMSAMPLQLSVGDVFATRS